MKNGEVFLTLLPSTPLSAEDLTAILDGQLKMLSEFQIGIFLERKGWQADLNKVCEYLQKLSRSLTQKKV
jgi:hypothetical protein